MTDRPWKILVVDDIEQNVKLLDAILSRLDLNQEISPEVHKAVAAILTFVYRLTKQRQQGQGAD